jgi:hypothetical protein
MAPFEPTALLELTFGFGTQQESRSLLDPRAGNEAVYYPHGADL